MAKVEDYASWESLERNIDYDELVQVSLLELDFLMEEFNEIPKPKMMARKSVPKGEGSEQHGDKRTQEINPAAAATIGPNLEMAVTFLTAEDLRKYADNVFELHEKQNEGIFCPTLSDFELAGAWAEAELKTNPEQYFPNPEYKRKNLKEEEKSWDDEWNDIEDIISREYNTEE